MATRLTAFLLACVLVPHSLAAQPERGQVGTGVPFEAGSQKTEEQLKAEIAAGSRSPRPYVELAQLFRRMNRVDDAERVLREGMPLFQNPAIWFSQIVSLYSVSNNLEKVLQIAEEWRQAQPSSALPFVAVADAHIAAARLLRAKPLEAQPHVDLATRAIEDAKLVAAQEPGVFMASVRLLRVKTEIETDPGERAKLLQELDQLTQQMPQGGIRRSMPSGVRSELRWNSSASSASSDSSASPAPPGAVRVGGSIRAPAKTKDLKPVYPPDAHQARVQGVVVMEVVIGADGRVSNARVLRSIPMLDQAALDAVQQWEFEPTLLNGQPVPVIMTVTVGFSLVR
jgi:TonB family protein